MIEMRFNVEQAAQAWCVTAAPSVLNWWPSTVAAVVKVGGDPS